MGLVGGQLYRIRNAYQAKLFLKLYFSRFMLESSLMNFVKQFRAKNMGDKIYQNTK